MSVPEIQEAIRKRLEIDSADDFDLGSSLTVTPRGKTRVIRINYESVTPILFNISALLTFDHSVEVRGGE
jgi:flagellar assembly factor FliW